MKNAYKILVGKSAGTCPPGRPLQQLICCQEQFCSLELSVNSNTFCCSLGGSFFKACQNITSWKVTSTICHSVTQFYCFCKSCKTQRMVTMKSSLPRAPPPSTPHAWLPHLMLPATCTWLCQHLKICCSSLVLHAARLCFAVCA